MEGQLRTSRLPSPGGFTWKHVVRFTFIVLLAPGVLFLSSGRLDWGAAWAYSVLAIVATLVSRLLVARAHPDLLAERARSGEREGVMAWDRALVPVTALLGPLAGLLVAGLDVRFGWTRSLSVVVQVAGFVVILAAYAFSTWAMAVNRFFSAYVRIQADRGHTVVSEGPYRWIRHPGYAGGVLASLAVPFALGALWALVPAAVTIAAQIVRTALEDQTLQRDLPGYREYARQVRYRFVPGVW